MAARASTPSPALVRPTPSRAARGVSEFFGFGSATPRFEILVFERENCGYCDLFRDTVAQRYKAGPHAQSMPMRFIDIDKADTDALGLKSRLTMLPTAVVMKDGAEVDRVPGLTAPDTFFSLVQHILRRAD